MPSSDCAPDRENDDSPNHRTDQASSFTRAVPPDSLPQVSGDECAHDAQNGGQNEPGRLIVAGHDELGDHASDETDNDGPEDAHRRPTLLIGKATSISGSGLCG